MSDNSDDSSDLYPSTSVYRPNAFVSTSASLSLPFASFSSSSFSLPSLSCSQRSTGAVSPSQKDLSYPDSHTKRALAETVENSKRAPSQSPSMRSTASTVTNPGSSSRIDDAFTISDDESAWVCSIAESRGIGKEIGVALLEIGTGRCVLSQFADTQMYGHLLHLLSTHPTKVILLPGPTYITSSYKASSAENDSLRRTLKQNLDASVINIHRKMFDEQEGLEYLQHILGSKAAVANVSEQDSLTHSTEIAEHTLASCSILSAIHLKYFALSAACALFKYLEGDHKGRLPAGSISLSYQAPEGAIMIELQTIKDLELIHNNITRKSSGTLYGLVNYCSTPMGERLLRMNIVQPMADPTHLVHRFDAIEELITKSDKFFALKQGLKSTMKKRVDMDKLISQMMRPSASKRGSDPKIIEAALSQLIQIRHILDALSEICASLVGCESLLLKTVHSLLQDKKILALVAIIDSWIHSDLLQGTAKSTLSSRNARLYAVRAGKDSILDAARQTYQENTADALEQCERYAEQYNLPFKINFSSQSSSGYSLELPAGEIRARDLPKQFVNVVTKRGGKSITMTTVDLKKCNQRMNDSIQEVFLLSENAVERLRLEVIKEVGLLYKASEALALIDVISSLTHCALAGRYTRPHFGDTLIIEGGRHPILDQKDHQKTIANDTRLGDNCTFQLLSGPNSSGKTTYLKQVALLTVMAHIGSFVPAKSACFPPRDRILSRLSNDDEPEANLSTFATEMKTMALILDKATDLSLVLIDELGRATSTHEGVAIAHATSESLILRKVTTIFATHFIQLATTLSPYANFTPHHLLVSLVQQSDGAHSFSYQHRIVTGSSVEDHYGIVMARDCCLPTELLEEADRMAEILSQKIRIAQNHSNGNRTACRRNVIIQLQKELEQFCTGPYSSPSILRSQLDSIQRVFIEEISVNLPNASEADHAIDDTTDMDADMNEFLTDYNAREA